MVLVLFQRFFLLLRVDSVNIAFLFLILSLLGLIDWISGFECGSILLSLLCYGLFLLFIISISTYSILFFFIYFETCVIILFLLIILFCSSYYKIRTSFYLYIFSAIGCLFLYLYLILFILWSLNIIFIISMLFIPFIIKIPTFPFYYWLPEVHCEVNTSTSLFLAGLLLKLGSLLVLVS